MAKLEQNAGGQNRELRCDQWEELIAEAVDGTLSPADAAAFTRHQEQCAVCAQMFKETQQGKAWMAYLVPEPAAPDDLTQRILARTSALAQHPADAGVAHGQAEPGALSPALPAWRRIPPGMLGAARQVLEPRLMMTVAMAFFSIALTLNLTGIKLSEVRAADLEPARLRANVTRQYYSTNEQVMKYYANLRVVYEMEARVRELRRITETAPAPRSTVPPAGDAPSSKAPRDGSGTPSSRAPASDAKPQDQERRTHLQRETSSPSEMVEAHAPLRIQPPPPGEALSVLPVRFPALRHPGIYKQEVFRTSSRHSALDSPAKTVNPGIEARAERNQV